MTLSGKQYRYQNQVPLLVSADYIFTRDNAVKPYAGLGLGTMYSERATDMGTWRLLENPWHFALKPEIGLMYDMSPGTAFKLSARYYTGFGSGDLETQSYFTISAGFAFKF
jgi:outer membrane protein